MTYQPQKGQSIYRAAQAAVELAQNNKVVVQFDFNEIAIDATPNSNPDDLAIIYSLKSELRRLRRHAR